VSRLNRLETFFRKPSCDFFFLLVVILLFRYCESTGTEREREREREREGRGEKERDGQADRAMFDQSQCYSPAAQAAPWHIGHCFRFPFSHSRNCTAQSGSTIDVNERRGFAEDTRAREHREGGKGELRVRSHRSRNSPGYANGASQESSFESALERLRC